MAALISAGFKPDLIIAAPWIEMANPASLIRTVTRGMKYPTAAEVASDCNIPYAERVHNSDETIQLLKGLNCSIGVILGARVLSHRVIEQFSFGVVNAHSGVLPHNRGLDCEKWAVYSSLPQASTLHMIDSDIDRGVIVDIEIVSVFEDDSFVDIAGRIQNASYNQLVSFLKDPSIPNMCVKNDSEPTDYHGRMGREIERSTLAKFGVYKSTYEQLLARWMS